MACRRNIPTAPRLYRACSLCLLLLLSSVLPVLAERVPVHFAEGTVRGFIELGDLSGKRIASGDFLQTVRGGEVTTRTVLYFKDGSLHDESAVFSQQRHFLLKSYRLTQKGQAFENAIEVALERAGGRYRVAQVRDGKQEVDEGKLELPPDVYNGMVPIVMKNISDGAAGKIRLVTFTPRPRVVEVEMVPAGEEKLLVGHLEKRAEHYILKPKLGLLKLPAALLGLTPPDNHIWTIKKDVPAFVKFEGPLALGGAIWRIELTSPHWPGQ